MPDNSTRHRRPGSLAATLLAVALTTLGCGASDPTERAEASGRTPDGLPHLRTPGGHPPKDARSGSFDVSQPTIGNLDPDLLDALQAAAREAQHDGVRMVVTSGCAAGRTRSGCSRTP